MTPHTATRNPSKQTSTATAPAAVHQVCGGPTSKTATISGWIAVAMATSLLVACGGGGNASDANNSGNNSGGTDSTATQQAVAPRYRLVPPIVQANSPGLMYVLFKSPISASSYKTSASQWIANNGADLNYCLNNQGQWIAVGSLLSQLSYLSATDTRWVVDKEACGDGAITHTAQVQDISGQKLQALYPNWAAVLGADGNAAFPSGSSTLINWASAYSVDTLVADTSTSITAYGVGVQGLIDHYATQSSNAITSGLGTYKLQFTSGSNGSGSVTLTSTINATVFNAQYTIGTLRGQQYIKVTGWPTAADMKQKDLDGDLGVLNASLLNAGQYPVVVLVNGAARWATFSTANTPIPDAINAAAMPLAMNKTALDAVLQIGRLPAFGN